MSEKVDILLIDDDEKLRRALTMRLESRGWSVRAEASAEAALQALDGLRPGLVLADLRLPGMNGIDLLERLQVMRPGLPVVMISAHGEIPDAVRATQSGAVSFLSKPLDAEELAACIERHLDGGGPTESTAGGRILTRNPAMLELLDKVRRVAKTQSSVLINGPSGAGKEVLARFLHEASPRRKGPFIALNCGAVPAELLESELFGHKKGAFTGASQDHQGLFRAADGGTLFLDEIGDMPLSMQARLLRVLQDRCVQPVGGSSSVAVDISLVCATHRVLADAVRAGGFREDLYYRVNGLTVSLPPLRARSDIRRIVRRLVAAEIEDGASGRITVSEEVMRLFERRPWPGNIRQLQNVLRVAVALLDEGEREICPRHLPEAMFAAEPAPGEQTSPLRQPAARAAAAPGMLSARGMRLKEAQLDVIERVMEEVGGNLTAAARQLGISRNTLYRRLGRMR